MNDNNHGSGFNNDNRHSGDGVNSDGFYGNANDPYGSNAGSGDHFYGNTNTPYGSNAGGGDGFYSDPNNPYANNPNANNPYANSPYANPYGANVSSTEGKGLAIASMVLGIISLALFIYFSFLGILAIVFAIVAKKKGFTGGSATAGLVMGIISTAIFVLALGCIVFACSVYGAYFWDEVMFGLGYW